MRVGIVDVGSNTVRLLVASRGPGGLELLLEERSQLLLGEEVARDGRISDERLRGAARCVGSYAALARERGAERIEVIVTAPGRQSRNALELVQRLAEASAAPVRVLSAEEEGRLAYAGAVGSESRLPETVGVCDVGGGSTELVIGKPMAEPAWCRSLDLGCLALTVRLFRSDPPTGKELVQAQREVERSLTGLVPPLPLAALATGGTARSLRKLVGSRLGEAELELALRKLSRRSSSELVNELGFDRARAQTLPAGALILAGVQSRVGVPFAVARGGLREGAALALVAEAAVA